MSSRKGKPIIIALNQSSTLEVLHVPFRRSSLLNAFNAFTRPSVKTIKVSGMYADPNDRSIWSLPQVDFRTHIEADSRLRELVKDSPSSCVFLFYST